MHSDYPQANEYLIPKGFAIAGQAHAVPLDEEEFIRNSPIPSAPPEQTAIRANRNKAYAYACCSVVSLLLCAVGVAAAALFLMPVTITASSSSVNSIVSEGALINVSMTTSSWNSRLCDSWEWDIGGESVDGKDAAIFLSSAMLADSTGALTVEGTCSNRFGHVMGSDEIILHTGLMDSNVRTAVDNSSIIKCPNGTNQLTASTQFIPRKGDIIYSSLCAGVLANVIAVSPPQDGAMVVTYNESSLEDVFQYLSTPIIPIPYPTFSVQSNKLVSRLGLTGTLLDATNWRLPFSFGVVNGALTFNSILWQVSTSIKQLTYENGKFQSLVWHSGTTVKVDMTFTAGIQVGQVATQTIHLLSLNSPPVVLPVPLLEFVTVNVDLDISLQLTAVASIASSTQATWRVSALLQYEWEVSCDHSLHCSASLYQSTSQFLTSPVGLFDNSDHGTTDMIQLSAKADVAVGLQLDELLAVNDVVSFALTLFTSDPLLCPTMSVAISDDISVDLRVFTLRGMTLFTYPVYSGSPIALVVADCQTLAPSAAPSRSPNTNPTMMPSGPTSKYPIQFFVQLRPYPDYSCGAYGQMGNYDYFLFADGTYGPMGADGARLSNISMATHLDGAPFTYTYQYPDCECGELRIYLTCYNVPKYGTVPCVYSTELANPISSRGFWGFGSVYALNEEIGDGIDDYQAFQVKPTPQAGGQYCACCSPHVCTGNCP